MLKLCLFNLLISIPYLVFSQCTGNEPVLFLGNDTTLCQGSSLTLTAPNSYGYRIWSNNSTNATLNVSAEGNYSVEVGTIQSNLVTNGTFESGNTGFTTGYFYSTTNGPMGYGLLENPGTYQIKTSPNLAHTNFASCSDHTVYPGTKMLIVNGSGTPNSLVWSQTIPVTPNTDFILGAWFMSALNDPNVANLQFFINNVQIGAVFSTSPTACVWQEFNDVWNSGSSTSAVLSIINQNTVNTGNDFAIDDITFTPVCKHVDDINITLSPLPTHTPTTVSPTSCTGAPDGSITINSPTGTQFSFDGGVSWQASNVKTGLAAGTYTIQTKNAAGCIFSSTVTLASLMSAPTQTTTFVSPNACSAIPDGSIIINSSTGVQYSFDGGTSWQASNVLTGLSAGNYTVLSENASGCTISSTVILTSAPNATTLSVSSDVSICQNGSATLTAIGSGGTSFVYHWADFVGTGSTQIISPSITRYYVVQVENQNGCFSPKDSILVTVLSPISAIISSPVQVCPNESVNLSVSNISGGQAPYTIIWNSGASILGTGTTLNANVSTTTFYSVGITDACESTAKILTTSITIKSLVLPPFIIEEDHQCEPATFKIVNTMDTSQILNTVWQISNGESYYSKDQIILSDYQYGSYDVLLIATIVGGCTDSVFLSNALTVYSKPTADFGFNQNSISALNPTVNLVNQSLNANSYVWNIQRGSPNYSTDENVTSTFPQGETGNYDVLLIAQTENNCFDSIIKTITVVPEQLLYVPNSFTPNDDKNNQTWKIHIAGYDYENNFELNVFNRWGELVWKSNNILAEWDGSFKGESVSDGIYSWSIVTKDIETDKKYYFNGNLNILR